MVSYGEAKVAPTAPPKEIRTMTTTANDKSTNLAKFQSLLRDLFQFDCTDLDFGIYRIMNHKRDAVERFITEQLPASIAAELDSAGLWLNRTRLLLTFLRLPRASGLSLLTPLMNRACWPSSSASPRQV